MTKPVVVENMDEAPGVARTDTGAWPRGPGGQRQPKVEPCPPELPKPKFELPDK